MNKPFKILLIIISILLISQSSFAFWVWTPGTNKWVNPKHSVKETPADQLAFALDFYHAKKYKEAVSEFNKLLKSYPRAKEAPEAQYYIGLSWEEQDNLVEAFKQYQVVVDKYPFSERSAEIVRRQFDLGVALLEKKSKKKFLDLADEYDVVDIFRAVIKNAPYSDLAPLAHYKIGLYLQEKKLYQEARDEFEKLMNDYPESEWAKASKFQIALSDSKRSTDAQYDQKITRAAVDEFKDYVDNSSNEGLSAAAKDQISQLREKEAENNFIVAQFYEKQKNFKAATIYYQSIVDEYKDSAWSSKALSKLQEIAPKIQ